MSPQNLLHNKQQQPKSHSPNAYKRKRLRSTKNPKSAWALASPRFAGDTKYHEAMMESDKAETMTPGRLDQRRRSNGAQNLKVLVPQTCPQPRRQCMYGNDGRQSLPTFEVTIPSFETKMSPPLKKRDMSTTRSTPASTIMSSPRRRRLEDDYYNNMPASSSLTDSNSLSFPTTSSQPHSEEYQLRREQLAQQRQVIWENQEVVSLSSYDSENESLLWDAPNNNVHKKETKTIVTKTKNELDNNTYDLDVSSFLSSDQTKATDKSTDKSKEKHSIPSSSLVESVQTLEHTIAKLKRELKEKDEIIDKLKLHVDKDILNKEYESRNTVSKKLCCINNYHFC